ncbi:uncharacterized protein LOC124576016 [Schistocerca americana]|uniref:uncharacterized protein LOC124576016 n=1 Tax=Schistocerca americana TaxID=7009 RepID=UPI001F50089C|nr:uncharacterized protein LOC124576016 [Schistocerca americana]
MSKRTELRTAKGVADRRPVELATSAAPSGPPLMTDHATNEDMMDIAMDALTVPLPESEEDEPSGVPPPRRQSGKSRREDDTAPTGGRSSPVEKRSKQTPADDADGFTRPKRRHTARRRVLSTHEPASTANTFAALEDAPEDPPRPSTAPRRDAPLPPIVLKYEGTFRQLQQLLNSWTTAVYNVKVAGRDMYKITLRSADDYRRVTQEASERAIPFFTHATTPDRVLKIVIRYRGCEAWRRASARQRGQPVAAKQKKSAKAEPTISHATVVARGLAPRRPNSDDADHAGPQARRRNGDSHTRDVFEDAGARHPLLNCATPPAQNSSDPEPGPSSAALPVTSDARPQRRGGRRKTGGRTTNAPEEATYSGEEVATSVGARDDTAPAASATDIASLITQLTALVASTTKLLDVLTQHLTAAQKIAAPAATRRSSITHYGKSLPRRQVVPAAAPQQRQAPLPAATQRVADQSARAFPAPPARAVDQPPAAAPNLASPKDFPEPRWRRPTAPRHTVGARQDGGQMETNARHVVGGNAANEARVERMLSCMETMMQQMTELLAVVQKVASAIQPRSHHA